MTKTNLERMIQLADEFFDVKNDPDQIAVDDKIMEHLEKIHPSTITQEEDANGPIAWTIVIPTTHSIMKQFLEKKINERQLLNTTPLQGTYEAVYLCSALVLPEYRGRGLAKRLLSQAVKSIRQDHPIKSVFYWSFSTEGERLAISVAKETDLELYKREG